MVSDTGYISSVGAWVSQAPMCVKFGSYTTNSTRFRDLSLKYSFSKARLIWFVLFSNALLSRSSSRKSRSESSVNTSFSLVLIFLRAANWRSRQAIARSFQLTIFPLSGVRAETMVRRSFLRASCCLISSPNSSANLSITRTHRASLCSRLITS